MTEPRKTVVALFSGGLDSTVLVAQLVAEGYLVRPIFCNYAQRHFEKEFQAARRISAKYDLRLHRVCVPVGARGNALTDIGVDVPHGHYEAESMKLTVVPNRNAVLLNVAASFALSIGASALATAVHAGDHAIYPDCRPAFIEAVERSIRLGTDSALRVLAPFVNRVKATIVRRGIELGVPFELTWSCYEGGHTHCGKCGTCVERREAFVRAEATDPTLYSSDLPEPSVCSR